MDNNLNLYFVIFKVYNGDQIIYQSVCPRSLIKIMMFDLIEKFANNQFNIKIFDFNGKLRSDLFAYRKLNFIPNL